MSNKFVFIAPTYNASKTIAQLLYSLTGQSYKNWKLILIDDMSSDLDKTKYIVNEFRDMLAKTGQKIDEKIRLYDNTTLRRGKQWEVSNVLYGLKLCDDNDIICRIDGDDYLTDLDALAIINHFYETTGAEIVWTAHRWGLSDRNISDKMSNDANPYTHPWVTSHLKTFRKSLINNVPYENFLNMNNQLVQRCGDQAIYLPCLYKSKKRLYIPRCLYHYTIDEQGGAVYQTDDAKFQKAEADFIRQRGYISEGISWEKVVT
jgi:glycosyltransferase involved in cell wall biosynthesis